MDDGQDNGDHPWGPAEFHWDRKRLTALRLGEVDDEGEGELGEPAPPDEDGTPTNESAAGAGEKCMVKGCPVDLSQCKAYYRRFRICERHLKTLSLCIEGRPSRFCQQCGRFHPLEEFEGTKRSCRRALLTRFYKRRNLPVPAHALPPPGADSMPHGSARDTDTKAKEKPRPPPPQDLDQPQQRRKRGRPRAPPLDVRDSAPADEQGGSLLVKTEPEEAQAAVLGVPGGMGDMRDGDAPGIGGHLLAGQVPGKSGSSTSSGSKPPRAPYHRHRFRTGLAEVFPDAGPLELGIGAASASAADALQPGGLLQKLVLPVQRQQQHQQQQQQPLLAGEEWARYGAAGVDGGALGHAAVLRQRLPGAATALDLAPETLDAGDDMGQTQEPALRTSGLVSDTMRNLQLSLQPQAATAALGEFPGVGSLSGSAGESLSRLQRHIMLLRASQNDAAAAMLAGRLGGERPSTGKASALTGGGFGGAALGEVWALDNTAWANGGAGHGVQGSDRGAGARGGSRMPLVLPAAAARASSGGVAVAAAAAAAAAGGSPALQRTTEDALEQELMTIASESLLADQDVRLLGFTQGPNRILGLQAHQLQQQQQFAPRAADLTWREGVAMHQGRGPALVRQSHGHSGSGDQGTSSGGMGGAAGSGGAGWASETLPSVDGGSGSGDGLGTPLRDASAGRQHASMSLPHFASTSNTSIAHTAARELARHMQEQQSPDVVMGGDGRSLRDLRGGLALAGGRAGFGGTSLSEQVARLAAARALRMDSSQQQLHQQQLHQQQQQVAGLALGEDTPLSLKDAARELLTLGGYRATYAPPSTLLERVSLKVHNCRPDQLPPDLAERLADWLVAADSSVLQGFVRPGCTNLILDVLYSDRERLQTALLGPHGADPRLFVEQLAHALLGRRFGDMHVQLGDQVLMLQHDRAALQGRTAAAPWGAAPRWTPRFTGTANSIDDLLTPVLLSVAPIAVVAGFDMTLELVGHCLDAPGLVFHVRFRGGHLDAMRELSDSECGDGAWDPAVPEGWEEPQQQPQQPYHQRHQPAAQAQAQGGRADEPRARALQALATEPAHGSRRAVLEDLQRLGLGEVFAVPEVGVETELYVDLDASEQDHHIQRLELARAAGCALEQQPGATAHDASALAPGAPKTTITRLLTVEATMLAVAAYGGGKDAVALHVGGTVEESIALPNREWGSGEGFVKVLDNPYAAQASGAEAAGAAAAAAAAAFAVADGGARASSAPAGPPSSLLAAPPSEAGNVGSAGAVQAVALSDPLGEASARMSSPPVEEEGEDLCVSRDSESAPPGGGRVLAASPLRPPRPLRAASFSSPRALAGAPPLRVPPRQGVRWETPAATANGSSQSAHDDEADDKYDASVYDDSYRGSTSSPDVAVLFVEPAPRGGLAMVEVEAKLGGGDARSGSRSRSLVGSGSVSVDAQAALSGTAPSSVAAGPGSAAGTGGGLLSEWVPLLVLPQSAAPAAAELNSLLGDVGADWLRALVVDMGLVVEALDPDVAPASPPSAGAAAGVAVGDRAPSVVPTPDPSAAAKQPAIASGRLHGAPHATCSSSALVLDSGATAATCKDGSITHLPLSDPGTSARSLEMGAMEADAMAAARAVGEAFGTVAAAVAAADRARVQANADKLRDRLQAAAQASALSASELLEFNSLQLPPPLLPEQQPQEHQFSWMDPFTAVPQVGHLPSSSAEWHGEVADSPCTRGAQPLCELDTLEALSFFGFAHATGGAGTLVDVRIREVTGADAPDLCAAAAPAVPGGASAAAAAGGARGSAHTYAASAPQAAPHAAAAAMAQRQAAALAHLQEQQHSQLAVRARALLVFFCNRGFPHCAALALTYLLGDAGVSPDVAAACMAACMAAAAPAGAAAAAPRRLQHMVLPLQFAVTSIAAKINSESGMSLLHHAVRSGHEVTVRLMLEVSRWAAAPFDVREEAAQGVTPVDLARVLPTGGEAILAAFVSHAAAAAGGAAGAAWHSSSAAAAPPPAAPAAAVAGAAAPAEAAAAGLAAAAAVERLRAEERAADSVAAAPAAAPLVVTAVAGVAGVGARTGGALSGAVVQGGANVEAAAKSKPVHCASRDALTLCDTGAPFAAPASSDAVNEVDAKALARARKEDADTDASLSTADVLLKAMAAGQRAAVDPRDEGMSLKHVSPALLAVMHARGSNGSTWSECSGHASPSSAAAVPHPAAGDAARMAAASLLGGVPKDAHASAARVLQWEGVVWVALAAAIAAVALLHSGIVEVLAAVLAAVVVVLRICL